MPNEIITLPRRAHGLIVEAIRSSGITIEPHTNPRLKNNRRPGDMLYLCSKGDGAVEILVPGRDEIPLELGDFTAIVLFPHGGLLRRLRTKKVNSQLHNDIMAALIGLKSQFNQ